MEQDPKDLVELGALLAGIPACPLYSRKDSPSGLRHVNAQTSAKGFHVVAFGGCYSSDFPKSGKAAMWPAKMVAIAFMGTDPLNVLQLDVRLESGNPLFRQ